MQTATSKDGTPIAFERVGSGPPLILVDGALQHSAFNQGRNALATLLAPHFSVVHYDRRGRGESGDTWPFAVEREIEDIDALIDAAGTSAFVFGVSSGAALAMEAAITLGRRIEKLAMYEAPYNDDDAARHVWIDYKTQLANLLAEGRNGDAVVLFMMLVGMPAEHVPAMREDPGWPLFEAVAPTLAYDAAALGDEAAVPTERAARVVVPALVMDGSASYPFMRVAALALAGAMPSGQHRTLEGQTHEFAPEMIAPVLVEFFASNDFKR